MASLVNVLHRRGDDLDVGRLVGPRERIGAITIADRLSACTLQVSRDDIVLHGGSAGVVAACSCDASGLHAIVQPLQRIRALTSKASLYKRLAGLEAWPASSLQGCLGWQNCMDGSMIVLHA